MDVKFALASGFIYFAGSFRPGNKHVFRQRDGFLSRFPLPAGVDNVVGIFFTTIFYEPDALGPTLGPIMMLNPISPILEAIRLVVINGHNLFDPLYNDGGFVATDSNVIVWQPWYMWYTVAFSFIALYFSWLHFHKSEFLYAEYI